MLTSSHNDVVKDENGEVVELPARSTWTAGRRPHGRKIRTLHWAWAGEAVKQGAAGSSLPAEI